MSSPYSKVRTSIVLDWEVLKKVKAEAEHERRSVSQLIEIWIEQALEVQQSLREGKDEPH